MPELLTVVAACTIAAAAWVRFQSIRPALPTHAQRHLLVALCAVALSLVLTAPSIRAALAPIGPVPYAIQLAENGAGMLAAYSIIVMVVYVTAGPDPAAIRRRKRRLAVAMCLALVAVGVCLDTSGAEVDRDLVMAATTSVEVVVGQVMYWSFLGACVARFVLLMRRYLSVPEPRPQMRYSMSVGVAAALVAMVSILGNVVAMAATRTDRPVAGTLAAAVQLLSAAAVMLLAMGVAWPVVGAWSFHLARRWRVGCALRGITPLWRQLTTMVPEVALRQVTLTDQPSMVLYRRVIEIRDAELILLRYVPSVIDGEVLMSAPRPRRAGHVAVRAEAIALATAMDCYLAGHGHPATPVSAHHVSIATSDLLAEARWLISVHRAIQTDPTVARIRSTRVSS